VTDRRLKIISRYTQDFDNKLQHASDQFARGLQAMATASDRVRCIAPPRLLTLDSSRRKIYNTRTTDAWRQSITSILRHAYVTS